MTRRPEFDPQAIPNFNATGRIGELDPDEVEERQSSVQSGAQTGQDLEAAQAPTGNPDPVANGPGAFEAP